MATTPDFSVAGKHVLITGGTGGIGGAFAKAFLDHGAHVIVADLAAPKDGTDPRIRYEQLDVRDDAAVEALAARVEKLDVVIHCAGRIARWEEYKPEVFKDILDIHLVGNLRLANAFRRSKINRRRNPASAAQSLEPGKGSQPLFPARWLVVVFV
jgi:NAD(P)-dependent dehydrogenase (short-subunit alcohol dehydrogenase family)